MALKSTEKANAFINEHMGRAKEQQGRRKELKDVFSNKSLRERKPPADFIESSFLYSRSFDDDLGVRPFSGITYWNSPDIKVTPVENELMPTTNLVAGNTYKLSCMVRNRGDLHIPSAKVEFFLVTPSLGFSTLYASKIGVAANWVGAYSSSEVSINYTVPPDAAGHKCLFARVFSFSPLDIPLDDYGLNPVIDRHVAQKNLDIIARGTTYIFNLVHFPGAQVNLQIIPLAIQEMILLSPNTSMKPTPIRDLDQIKIVPLSDEVNVKSKNGIYVLKFKGESERGSARQKEIYDAVHKMLNTEKVNEKHKELLKSFRKLNKQKIISAFSLNTKGLLLPEKTFTAFHIIAKDVITNEDIGGITIFVNALLK